jgi:hypothetical protein
MKTYFVTIVFQKAGAEFSFLVNADNKENSINKCIDHLSFLGRTPDLKKCKAKEVSLDKPFNI